MSNTVWRIRDAELRDAAELAVLMSELDYETQTQDMEMRLKSILSNRAFKTFVATVDGRVCGMIGMFTYASYEHNDPGARIVALVTLSTARRRGIGRALIAAAEEDLAQKGITRVSLNTSFARKGAHKFYESLGYKRNGWRFMKQLAVSASSRHSTMDR